MASLTKRITYVLPLFATAIESTCFVTFLNLEESSGDFITEENGTAGLPVMNVDTHAGCEGLNYSVYVTPDI